MEKNILVIQADEKKYVTINNLLSDLHYSADTIYRSHSIDQSFSLLPGNISIILVDISCMTDGLSSDLQTFQKHFKNVPVIVLADNSDKDAAIQAIREGAQDFLIYGSFDAAQLEKAILFAIERKATILNKEATLREYSLQFDNGPIPMWIIESSTSKFMLVNKAAVEKYGYTKDEFSRMTIQDIRQTEDLQQILKHYNGGRSNFYDAGIWRHLKKNGELFYAHVY